ncbi:hypothetical protein ACFYO9_11990 [Streptomyces sp. NPDC005863]|uniref:hypothetical protein n=1 Tax=unclassified Streptomyces TaxID=2593676 RepID=UPI003406BD29
MYELLVPVGLFPVECRSGQSSDGGMAGRDDLCEDECGFGIAGGITGAFVRDAVPLGDGLQGAPAEAEGFGVPVQDEWVADR